MSLILGFAVRAKGQRETLLDDMLFSPDISVDLGLIHGAFYLMNRRVQ